MPITLRPGMVATRADSADMLRAMSSASAMTRLALMPLAGSSSYMVTTGPGPHLDDLAAHVEVLEHRFEQARVALQPGAVDLLARLLRAAGEQVDGRQLVAVAEREAGLGARRLAARRPPAGAFAPARRPRRPDADCGGAAGDRPLVAQSRLLRGAARRSRGGRRNRPASQPRSSLGQAEREIADGQAREREQQQAPRSRVGPGDLRDWGSGRSRASTPCAAARPSAPPQPPGRPDTAEPLVRPSATPSSTAPTAASSSPRPMSAGRLKPDHADARRSRSPAGTGRRPSPNSSSSTSLE